MHITILRSSGPFTEMKFIPASFAMAYGKKKISNAKYTLGLANILMWLKDAITLPILTHRI